MKILITGSEGFIGRNLSDVLRKDGHSILGFDVVGNNDSNKDYQFIAGDVRRAEQVYNIKDSVDVVIHLAAAHRDFGISEKEYFEVNVIGTKNILSYCVNKGVKRFIFFSSVAVYGAQDIPVTEEIEPNPDNHYGKSKLEAEKVAKDWAKQDSRRALVIIRPTVVFGPKNYGNMYNLIKQICSKKFVFVGDGNNIKSVAYIKNLVESVRFLLHQMKSGVEIYNYSDIPQMTTRQIVEIISDYAGVSLPKFKIPKRVAIGICRVFDYFNKLTGCSFPITSSRINKFCAETHYCSDKIRSLGFQAPVDLREGFKKTIEWYLRENKRK